MHHAQRKEAHEDGKEVAKNGLSKQEKTERALQDV